MKPSKILFSFVFLLGLGFCATLVKAQTVDELKTKIADRNNNIKQLEEEIKGYMSEITNLGQQADSLRKNILELDVSQKKLQADLNLTQAKIDNTTLELKELSL